MYGHELARMGKASNGSHGAVRYGAFALGWAGQGSHGWACMGGAAFGWAVLGTAVLVSCGEFCNGEFG